MSKILRRTVERLENYTKQGHKQKKKLTNFNNRSPEERNRKIQNLMGMHALLKEYIEKLLSFECASKMKGFQSLNLIEKKRFLDDLKKRRGSKRDLIFVFSV